MRAFFFLVLVLTIDLLPWNSSRFSSILSCFLDLLLSLIPCLIFLLMSLSLGPSLSCPCFSSLDEGQELLVFAVDHFFPSVPQ